MRPEDLPSDRFLTDTLFNKLGDKSNCLEIEHTNMKQWMMKIGHMNSCWLP